MTVTAGGSTTQNFTLTPNAPTTGTLTGTVTNSSGGAAISGATVSISGGGSTTTAANGTYTINNVTPGSNLSVTASKSGFTSSTATVTVTAGNTTTRNFSLTPNAPTTGTLTGTVTNSSGGAAISGATVSISGGGSATTAANGTYTINNVTPGSNLSVTASATGFTNSTVSTVNVTAGNTTTQNFSLTPTGGGATVPGAPTLSVGSIGFFQHGLKLSWSGAAANGSTITNYNIYRSTASGGEVLLTTVGNVSSYNDTSVSARTTYYYRVSAVNGIGEGALSNERSGSSFF